MLATDISTNRALGRLCSADAATAGPRHRLLYLESSQMVVLPYCRATGGWECIIVATRARRDNHHLTLTDAQIATALPTVPADAERDPDGYSRLVWLSEAFRRWPGGAMLAFTRHLVDELRIPASMHVPARALADHTRIAAMLPTTRPVAVGRLLDRLITAEMCVRSTHHLWRLAMPPAWSAP
jgi:hypothetical protein